MREDPFNKIRKSIINSLILQVLYTQLSNLQKLLCEDDTFFMEMSILSISKWLLVDIKHTAQCYDSDIGFGKKEFQIKRVFLDPQNCVSWHIIFHIVPWISQAGLLHQVKQSQDPNL